MFLVTFQKPSTLYIVHGLTAPFRVPWFWWPISVVSLALNSSKVGLALHDIDSSTTLACKMAIKFKEGLVTIGIPFCLSQWVAANISVRQLPLMSAGFRCNLTVVSLDYTNWCKCFLYEEFG